MVEVEISPLALSKIIDWTSSNTEREVGGYLIGEIQGKQVVIKEAIFAVADSNPTFVSFDNMAQFRIMEELEKKGGNEVIVGWWHTHPGMGTFLSGTDIATQKIYQALLPEAIAMVNDGNKYSQTRKQSDFKTEFFRVKDNKAHKINYGVTTNPNKLVTFLTDFIQQEENISRVIQTTTASVVNELKHFVATKEELLESKTDLLEKITEAQTLLEQRQEEQQLAQQELKKTFQIITTKQQRLRRILFGGISGLSLLLILELILLIIIFVRG